MQHFDKSGYTKAVASDTSTVGGQSSAGKTDYRAASISSGKYRFCSFILVLKNEKKLIKYNCTFQEQHRLLQMQQMHAFNQAMMQPPPSFGQDCNINFFNPAISSVAAQENEVSALDDDADDKPEM